MISEPELVPRVKYGWFCEWNRWIYGRHFTFRVLGAWVIVVKWDANDMWVESERWFHVPNAYHRFMQKFGIKEDFRYDRERMLAVLQDNALQLTA